MAKQQVSHLLPLSPPSMVPSSPPQQAAIKAQVRTFVDTHQVVCTGPFVYAYIEEVEYVPLTVEPCVPHLVCCVGNTQYEVLQSSSDSLQVGQVSPRSVDHWGEGTQSYSGSSHTLLPLLQNKRARTVPFILSAPIDVSKGKTAVIVVEREG